TPGQGTYDVTTGRWSVNTLSASTTTTLVLRATVRAPESISSLAVKTGQNEPDPNTANDSAAAATNAVSTADLALLNTVDRTSAVVGDAVTFTVTATNRGPGPATGIVVNDLLPAGLAFVSATPSTGTYDSTGGTWTLGSLAATQGA